MKRTLCAMMVAMSLWVCGGWSGWSMARADAGAVRGSGAMATETRHPGRITSVELDSAADVEIRVGQESGAVVVEAEDNILPLIETTVRHGKLIIGARPGASLEPTHPVRILVTVASLKEIRLSGSGSITASDLQGRRLKVDLPGSGNIAVTGSVNKVNITLSGSGQVVCGSLHARVARVRVPGSGNVTVFASDKLDASIGGSGNVQYSGTPFTLLVEIDGSGSIAR